MSTWKAAPGAKELLGPLHDGRNPRCQCQLADAWPRRTVTGFVHRDLKPEKHYVRAGRLFPRACQDLDFGLAKHLHQRAVTRGGERWETVSIATSPGLLVGTVNYMAPSNWKGSWWTVAQISTLLALSFMNGYGHQSFLGRTPPSTIG